MNLLEDDRNFLFWRRSGLPRLCVEVSDFRIQKLKIGCFSGSLIAPGWVLTAAHCGASEYVVLGKYTLDAASDPCEVSCLLVSRINLILGKNQRASEGSNSKKAPIRKRKRLVLSIPILFTTRSRIPTIFNWLRATRFVSLLTFFFSSSFKQLQLTTPSSAPATLRTL